jgi:citrate lyase subunit beta/citryl-CoA lyase
MRRPWLPLTWWSSTSRTPVSPVGKPAAREAIIAAPLDPSRVIVRVNATTTAEHAADLEALRATPYHTIMLPKAENRGQLDALSPWRVVALCETPLGVLGAAQIAAAPNVVALMCRGRRRRRG